MKQTDQLCLIDSIDLSRAVPSPRCTTVNCCCTWLFVDIYVAGTILMLRFLPFTFRLFSVHFINWMFQAVSQCIGKQFNYTVSNILTLMTITAKTFKAGQEENKKSLIFVSNNNLFSDMAQSILSHSAKAINHCYVSLLKSEEQTEVKVVPFTLCTHTSGLVPVGNIIKTAHEKFKV